MMLKNKTAIVTGSTSGIGKAVVERLAASGCGVVINGFGNDEEIDSQIKHIESAYSVKAIYSNADMTKPEEIKDMVDSASSEFGGVDILVNNAGIQHVDYIEDFPVEKWDAVIAINLSSAFHTIRNAIPYMKKNSFGRIINIASAHGLVASAKKSAYVVAKHGIVGLSKVIALETAGSGITCNSICPGWVLTPLVQKQIEAISQDQGISIDEASIKLLSEKQPSKEFVQPEQIGDLVVYLCSDSASSITGSSLSIDGGWTAQ
ncbi:3-hydroxybutyrate dehydrogenase [Rickettsiales bacterium]|nr:3-hydroxybutyrate dehydrogenase [Rickettsiales bacterium]